ncbi:MAG TPA: oligopeptide:H+ symporter [Legionella sp.]|nr:oligopeptide:H+ symporter [Legionella sp.]
MSFMMQRMPKGTTSLYFAQAFSTFAYAVLYACLTLYLTKQLGLSNTASNSIVGLFLAFNYVLHLLGGTIGGSYLSNRSLIIVTTIIQSIGIVLLAWSEKNLLYTGLSLFLIGSGLNTTCCNSLLTQLFPSDDSRKDKAFFWSYSAMNVGFFAGYIVSGLFDYKNQYQQLFYASAVINMLTVVFILYRWKEFKDHDTFLATLKNQTQKQIKNYLGVVGILILVPILILCFHDANLSNYLVILISIFMFFVILALGLRQKLKSDQKKIMVYLVLTVTSIVFWMIYYTGPMGVTLFIKNNVDKHFLNYEVPTQWILNINTILIIAGAPLLSMLINKLQSEGFKVSVTKQFVCAFFALALSFLFLTAAVIFSNGDGYCSLIWIVLHYAAQSIAELLIGPVGYAMIGRIAPAKLHGILMGTWMMVSGVSASLSQLFSNNMVKTESSVPLVTNPDYLSVFNQLCLWALFGGIFLYLVSSKIGSWVDGKNKQQSAALDAT